jgi:hypothetical protein|tara:strand:- start:457 stop:660 length:204 start_codon:yes stop_codon:yes gene_type:complete
MYNVVYKDIVMYRNLSDERAAEVLLDLSERFYSDEDFNIEQLKLEQVHGNDEERQLRAESTEENSPR